MAVCTVKNDNVLTWDLHVHLITTAASDFEDLKSMYLASHARIHVEI